MLVSGHSIHEVYRNDDAPTIQFSNEIGSPVCFDDAEGVYENRSPRA
jgi:hypothetical protein